MEIFDWQVAIVAPRDELKYVSREYGEPSAGTSGTEMMLQLHANNLASHQLVTSISYYYFYTHNSVFVRMEVYSTVHRLRRPSNCIGS